MQACTLSASGTVPSGPLRSLASGNDHPLQIIIQANDSLDCGKLKDKVVEKLKSSENFSQCTYPIRSFLFKQLSDSLSCSSESKSCVLVDVTFYNLIETNASSRESEVVDKIKDGIQACVPNFHVVVNSHYNPQVILLKELELLRKFEQIAIQLDGVEERLLEKFKYLLSSKL